MSLHRPIRQSAGYPLIFILLLGCCGPASGGGDSGAPSLYELVAERSFGSEDSVEPGLPFRPGLGPKGELVLSVPPLSGASACPAGERQVGSPVVWQQVPRVEEVRCQAKEAGRVTNRLLGYGANGEQKWLRELGFPSGKHWLDERVIGADSTAVVLSTLEVLDPRDGRSLLSANTRSIAGENRTVPLRSVQGPAVFLASERRILHFSADATVTRARGGLMSFDPRDATELVVYPVRKIFGGAFWRAEHLKLTPAMDRLLVAEKLGLRGGGGVALKVISVSDGRELYRKDLGGNHFCLDPRIVLWPGGGVSLVYRDESARTFVEAHFREIPDHR